MLGANFTTRQTGAQADFGNARHLDLISSTLVTRPATTIAAKSQPQSLSPIFANSKRQLGGFDAKVDKKIEALLEQRDGLEQSGAQA
ncbi:MAG: hypothetical protein WAK48_05825 [Candidatus Acidiferrum sp.]